MDLEATSFLSAMYTNNIELGKINPSTLAQAPKPRRRRPFDFATTLVLIAVWGFLVLIGIFLLGWARVATSATSEYGLFVAPQEVAATIAWTAIPVFFAAVLNEILVDRAWRRIVYFALRRKRHALDYATLAENLRAANLGPLYFIKRFFQCRLTRTEWRSALSYALIRWGTTLGIASAQLTVGWTLTADLLYLPQKRHIMLILPVIIHGGSLFFAIAIWDWPWKFFSDRFSDQGLLDVFQPYLQTVQGSLATFEAVAEKLEEMQSKGQFLYTDLHSGRQMLARIEVKAKVRSGHQVLAKLKGLFWGLLMTFVPPAAALSMVSTKYSITWLEFRFFFTLVFLAQNIFYVQALDFAVWNVSLDGFCKTPKAKPNKNLRHLGFSSGVFVLTRACRQRRPIRSAVFLWLFWLQACGMRFISVVYSLSITVIYYTRTGTYDVLDPRFWIGWLILTSISTLPLYILWIFKKVDAPICSVDNWRWAQIAQTAMEEAGYYGIRNKRAVWGHDVQLFSAHVNEKID